MRKFASPCCIMSLHPLNMTLTIPDYKTRNACSRKMDFAQNRLFCVVIFCIYTEILQWVNPPPKEQYEISKGFNVSELILYRSRSNAQAVTKNVLPCSCWESNPHFPDGILVTILTVLPRLIKEITTSTMCTVQKCKLSRLK